MSKKYTQTNIDLDKLVLDKNNPRFAELYNGSDKESEIINYLLYNESADEVAEAIVTAEEFYEDRPLWVYKDGDNYIVKDGNRRCSAVKALQFPSKYGLDLDKFEVKQLPVLVYNKIEDIETRIRVEHNSSLFKKWGRIAKAIEIYRLFSSGSSIESLTDIDSSPKDFIKIATFYHEATKLKGEDFKKLVREGRGDKGGKTIIFERLFKSRASCGYNFKRTTNEIMIKDNELFSSYVEAIVSYLIDNPKTTSRYIDDIGTDKFLTELKPYGFPPEKGDSDDDGDGDESDTTGTGSSSSGSTGTGSTGTGSSSSGSTGTGSTGTGSSSSGSTGTGSSSSGSTGTGSRGSTKTKPSIKRKKVPAPLKTLIDECYKLDENNFANSKTALTRVTFECVLKYVVENTKQKNGKPISVSNHFRSAFYDKKGNKLPYTNFTILKTKFSELILDTANKKAFQVLDLEIPHQIIHNYKVAAIPKQAKDLCNNLIELVEFMLQEEQDLINSLDITKL